MSNRSRRAWVLPPAAHPVPSPHCSRQIANSAGLLARAKESSLLIAPVPGAFPPVASRYLFPCWLRCSHRPPASGRSPDLPVFLLPLLTPPVAPGGSPDPPFFNCFPLLGQWHSSILPVPHFRPIHSDSSPSEAHPRRSCRLSSRYLSAAGTRAPIEFR